MRDPYSALSGVEYFLGLMCINVACLTVCDRFDIFENFVLDIEVTLVALNFIIGNVLFMHEVGIVVFIEAFLLHMAFVAVFSGDDSISHDGVAVTFAARVSVIEYKRMVIPGCFCGDEFLSMMAVGAVVDLRIKLALLKMADEACAFGDRDMLPLNDLRMTACALKFFPSF
jgi:hypothetical protein